MQSRDVTDVAIVIHTCYAIVLVRGSKYSSISLGRLCVSINKLESITSWRSTLILHNREIDREIKKPWRAKEKTRGKQTISRDTVDRAPLPRHERQLQFTLCLPSGERVPNACYTITTLKTGVHRNSFDEINSECVGGTPRVSFRGGWILFHVAHLYLRRTFRARCIMRASSTMRARER